jgi:hypothetical protein
MATSSTISPNPPLNKGEDYEYLQQTGIDLVQQLSSDIWTDYNEHDPGVTSLEQICYALTALSYRAELPLVTLLSDKTGRISTQRHALYIARRIFPCNPVTEIDYRKLIIDRVSTVLNVWLTPLVPASGSAGINGLYDISLYVPDLNSCATDRKLTPDWIKNRVRQVYCRHRNLCEDINSVSIPEPLRGTVIADVTLRSGQVAEKVLARLFFNLGLLLAPEPQRESLKTLLAAGLQPDAIFNGPLLRNGFIADDQLQPKAAAIPVNEVVRAIAQTAGVLSAKDVSVVVGGQTYGGNSVIPVPVTAYLKLDTRSDARDGGFSIRLFRNGVECRPDPQRTQRELDKLWTDYRRTYPLSGQYQELLGAPKGVPKDLRQYASIQNQFPNVYGINSYGLPAQAPAIRRGQAKQFKGYLLVFDQLMADYFEQLAHVKDLFSIRRSVHQTYWCQSLAPYVPDVDPLLQPDYWNGLNTLVTSEDPFLSRRNRFLDFLLALYAEQLSAPITATCQGENDPAIQKRLIRAKLALLRLLVPSTRNRGRGFDYLTAPSASNIAGMEIKCRIELDLNVGAQRPMVDVLGEFGLQIAQSGTSASMGRLLDRQADEIDESFVPVASLEEQPPAPGQLQLAPLVRDQSVTEDFLYSAADMNNFYVGQLPGEDAVALVVRAGSPRSWRLVGKYPNRQSAAAGAVALRSLAVGVTKHMPQLYIVEHILLRLRPLQDDTGTANNGFVYSFTITAVLALSWKDRQNLTYQDAVRQIIRENTPAHIVVNFRFLGPWAMGLFELLYWAWRQAMRRGAPGPINATSARLRAFLDNPESEAG